MVPVVGDPSCRSSRAVEHGPEDQEVLDDLVQLESAVRQQAVVTHRRAETAESHEKQSEAENLQARKRKKNQPNDSQYVYQDKIKKNSRFASSRFPKGLFPGSNFVNGGLAHCCACGTISRTLLAASRCIALRWTSASFESLPLGRFKNFCHAVMNIRSVRRGAISSESAVGRNRTLAQC